MTSYKHTQVGYLVIAVTIAVAMLFAWTQIAARMEPPSYDSGTNFAVTALMAIALFVLMSFSTLTIAVGKQFLSVRFGWGVFRKTFAVNEITLVSRVKNRWYCGWGIRVWLWPKTWLFNVSGFDAVEITMKDGAIYRIGTDEPEKLETTIKEAMNVV